MFVVNQEEGPIEFKFKEKTNGESYTYLNIDGEFYKAKNIDTLTVQLATETLPNGKLKILFRNK